MTAPLAVVTVVAGRRGHLTLQSRALACGTRVPDRWVIVVLDDEPVALAAAAPPTDIVRLPSTPKGLPLAAARNAGARRALATGASTLVFLDVDCLPTPTALARYAQVAEYPDADTQVMCGPVAYLPPAPRGGYDLDDLPVAAPHPARPAPLPGTLLDDGDFRLFWSLSFALTPSAWDCTGGFDEVYVGYGGEDTDFGQRARRAGLHLRWVGGAEAFHQHHPVSDPPIEHAADIMRNAALFHARWGWWPMEGWLQAFAARGIAAYDSRTDRWQLTTRSRAS